MNNLQTAPEQKQMVLEPESEWFYRHGQSAFSSVWRAVGHTQPVYVDLGCAHPVNKSLTNICRVYSWNGLAIDANPDYATDWAAAGYGRHFVCAVLSDQPTARFVTHENAFTSRISASPEHDHPERWGIKSVEERCTVPLNHLLEVNEIDKIDLLCCDLEGHEFAVLQTLDWEKYQPAWVIAEYVTQGEGVDSRLCNYLLERGYEVAHMTDSNIIYRRK